MAHLFVDDLTVLDCSILDTERGLIGASWTVSIELIGRLDQQNMVLDFSKVKKNIKYIVDRHVDHRLLIPSRHEGLSIMPLDKKHIELEFVDNNNQLIRYYSPNNAICLINAEQVDIAAVELYLTALVSEALPSNVEQVIIFLSEEQATGTYYTYSHGLKKHDGNCQRIAHGHRSQIKVWADDKRSSSLETEISVLWEDIYLGSESDISLQDASKENVGRIRFKYTTNQGRFMIELPQDRVFLIPNDTTVECLAEYLAKKISSQKPNNIIRVQAFEGIKKGAFAKVSAKQRSFLDGLF